MATDRYRYSFEVPVSTKEAFAWHERPGAFSRLAPPWQRLEVVAQQGTIHNGDWICIRYPLGPFHRIWEAHHRDFIAGKQFRDFQKEGPFILWDHVHRFLEVDGDRCRIEDVIEYELPRGFVGHLIGLRSVRRALHRTFQYREEMTRADLMLHAQFANQPRLKVAVTGASGLIGSALCALLATGGHEVYRFIRSEATLNGHQIAWDPERGVLQPDRLEGLDAVIHLAGENLAKGRWTKKRMEQIRRSRVEATQKLVEALQRVQNPPKTFIGASAIGYYGTGMAGVDETATKGEGFLADLAADWEAATHPLQKLGVRVAHGRLSMVLALQGGALKEMLPAFRYLMGGPMGKGNQIVSWVALDDAISMLYTLLMRDDLEGPFNLASPNPVSNRAFSRTLGRVLHRPSALRLPAWMLRLIFGKMADALLLSSCQAIPRRFQEMDYSFRLPSLEAALRFALGRWQTRP